LISILFLTLKNKVVGLGNYKRSKHFQNIIQNSFKTKLYNIKNIKKLENIKSGIFKILFLINPKIIIVDINNKVFNKKIKKNFLKIKKHFFLIGIDTDYKNLHLFNFNWLPTLKINKSILKKINKNKLFYGPKSILVKKSTRQNFKKKYNSIIFTIGSTGNINIYNKIIKVFEKKIKIKFKIILIIGPYAKKILIPKKTFHNWLLMNAPNNLNKYFEQSRFAILRFGLSFYEALNYNCKILYFTSNFCREKYNIKYIKQNNLAYFLKSINDIPKIINNNINLKKNFYHQDHNNYIIKKLTAISKKI